MTQESTSRGPAALGSSVLNQLARLGKKPRILLLLLAAWSLLALLTQIFVNSGLFLDTHDIEFDGAFGGLALSFGALPLGLFYLYCWRDPTRFYQIFWLAMGHQLSIAVAVLYHWAIGTFSVESIIGPFIGSVILALLSFLQLFEPRSGPASPQPETPPPSEPTTSEDSPVT